MWFCLCLLWRLVSKTIEKPGEVFNTVGTDLTYVVNDPLIVLSTEFQQALPTQDHPRSLVPQWWHPITTISSSNRSLDFFGKFRKSSENMFLRKSKWNLVSQKSLSHARMTPSFFFSYSPASWSYRVADVFRIPGFANLMNLQFSDYKKTTRRTYFST